MATTVFGTTSLILLTTSPWLLLYKEKFIVYTEVFLLKEPPSIPSELYQEMLKYHPQGQFVT